MDKIKNIILLLQMNNYISKTEKEKEGKNAGLNE